MFVGTTNRINWFERMHKLLFRSSLSRPHDRHSRQRSDKSTFVATKSTDTKRQSCNQNEEDKEKKEKETRKKICGRFSNALPRFENVISAVKYRTRWE